MATYFVQSGAANTTGLTWANAFTSLQGALTAASSGTDIVVIDKALIPAVDGNMTADTTYTPVANVSIISATADDTDVAYTPSIMGDDAWIGKSATTSYSITIASAFSIYMYGVTLRNAGTTNKSILLNNSGTGGTRFYEDCTFWLGAAHGSNGIWASTNDLGAGANASSEYLRCSFRFATTGTPIVVGGGARCVMTECLLHASSAACSPLFETVTATGVFVAEGCDWSVAGTNLFFNGNGNSVSELHFVNCKLPASFSVTRQTPASHAACKVFIRDCASGDTHFNFAYYDGLGEVVATTSLSAANGAKFDGTNSVSWKIDTVTGCTLQTPFYTPWIDMYHSGTSSITPYLVCLRDNSAGALFDDDEVWAEFLAKTTASSAKTTRYADEMANFGTPAAQASNSETWTGATGTPGKFKIDSGVAFTPAEIGCIKARICVGIPLTVYVDPYIRTT